MPIFSVVIPLFNKENFIERTLKSVLSQSFNDFELIVINDGSTDKSLEITENILKERGNCKIINQVNKGLSAARNRGIRESKGELIAFLDADDLWKHDFLNCIYFLSNKYHNEKVFATNCESFYIGKNQNLIDDTFDYNHELISDYFMRQRNMFSYSSVVFNKSIFKDIGFFDEHINFGEEEDFTIRCFLKYKLVYCKNIKAFRLDGISNQLTSPKKNSNRIIPDYNKYLVKSENISLKKYIDFVHYKLLVLFKMEANQSKVKFYKEKIDVSNLSFIQKIKYYLPIKLFYVLKSIYLSISR